MSHFFNYFLELTILPVKVHLGQKANEKLTSKLFSYITAEQNKTWEFSDIVLLTLFSSFKYIFHPLPGVEILAFKV